ncbi:hypothetical protein [Microbulbifer sp. THAF38]|uniref:hypothetical protein n=1 Tax=Microbulbifer sp. THAF38 TaxID=2587856 RepID=UPI0012684EBF|nr:hypothetical protein [Microbulbifer sp. THAF38]QFT55592.1 hypothetical protein FIU95_13640 [Microbulbifer sp. THAF38]
MKLMVMGNGRHGKDTFCEESGIDYVSSSRFAAEPIVFPALASTYGYRNVDECYEDRANHRADWHELIKEYNTPDKARLAREIFSKYDIYCGIRCKHEFLAAKEAGLFDLAIWVDAGDRLPNESPDSITVRPDHADIVIENNGSLAEFEAKVRRVTRALN